MTRNQLLLGIVLVNSFILISNALTYNETQLDHLYGMGTYLYNQTVNHWNMSSGYNEMMGTHGMMVCFVYGPELDALVLGEETKNSTHSTLELQNKQEPVHLPVPPDVEHQDFTLSLWYSMRPVDFFATINESMSCNLLEIGSTSSSGGTSGRALAIEYSGLKEYNLKYKFKNAYGDKFIINDDDERPNWEFQVNDTVAGGVKMRGWQWNHIAVVVKGDEFMAYYNGFKINKSAVIAEGQFKYPKSSKLMINVPIGDKTCGPVGFDEVAIWDYALTEENILALRIHVGRNQSFDYEYNPPTTECTTTTEDSTTVAGSTSESSTIKPSTVMETTTMETTTMETTTMETTTMETTTMETTVEETNGVVSTPEETTSVPMVATSGHAPHPITTTVPQPTTQATEYIATTESNVAMNIDQAKQNLTNGSIPHGVHKVLNTVESLFNSAPFEETDTISDNVIGVLGEAAKYKPPPLNSSKEIVKVFRDYRKAFVNLCSSVLERFEQTGTPPSMDGTAFVDVLETFLANYVNDPTVPTDESILSSAMDVKLAPPDGSAVKVDSNTTVTIPQDAFGEEDGLKVVICLLKKGLQDALEPKDGDQPIHVKTSSEYTTKTTWNITGPIIVMRVSNREGSVKLKKPIRFKVHVDPALGTDPICVYKKEGPINKWSGEGVTKVSYDVKCPCVICETNHLTNFAVLMSVDGVLTGIHADILSILTYVGCSMSLLCLFIAIILFIILRDLNSTRMGIVKNLCVALFLAQLLFLSGTETATVNTYACKVVAVVLHYLFLCVIAWMFCNGIYLYQKVQKATRPTSVVDLVYFCILGWGAPAVIVAITAGINHKVYGSADLCWLSVEGSGVWAFVAPAMVIIVFNALVTFLTMKAFVSVKVFKDKNDKDKIKSGLRAIVVMLPILGMSWTFGLLSFGETTIFFQYLFVIFNSLQGVFLFIFHILLNEEVKGALRRRFGKIGSSGDENMLFNKIWAFSTTGEKSTEMSSVTKTEVKAFKPVYKN